MMDVLLYITADCKSLIEQYVPKDEFEFDLKKRLLDFSIKAYLINTEYMIVMHTNGLNEYSEPANINIIINENMNAIVDTFSSASPKRLTLDQETQICDSNVTKNVCLNFSDLLAGYEPEEYQNKLIKQFLSSIIVNVFKDHQSIKLKLYFVPYTLINSSMETVIIELEFNHTKTELVNLKYIVDEEAAKYLTKTLNSVYMPKAFHQEPIAELMAILELGFKGILSQNHSAKSIVNIILEFLVNTNDLKELLRMCKNERHFNEFSVLELNLSADIPAVNMANTYFGYYQRWDVIWPETEWTKFQRFNNHYQLTRNICTLRKNEFASILMNCSFMNWHPLESLN